MWVMVTSRGGRGKGLEVKGEVRKKKGEGKAKGKGNMIGGGLEGWRVGMVGRSEWK